MTRVYDIHIDAYRDAEAQPLVYVASCDELPGLALGAETRALPGILGALGRAEERSRCRFIYKQGVVE